MASQQQSRIQSYLEKNKIGSLFEEMMASLISQTPDHPVPFLISHLQTKPGSPGKLHRTLAGSAALWAQSDAESKGGPDFRSYQKPWQIHPNKPKKSKSDLAVSNISLPSAESKSLPRSIEQPWWEWRESGDFNLILQESKTLGKALENLSRSIAVSDELDQNLGGYNSGLQPRVVGEWAGREEEDPDPLAAEMLQPPVPRTKTEAWGSADSSPAGSGKSKGLKQQQQHHKRLLAAMLSQESFDSAHSSAPSLTEEEMEDEDDVMELLEDLDDLRMEGVTGLAPSGSKFSQGRSSYCPEPQAKVTLNICSRCARLQGDSLSDASRPAEEHHGPPQHVPTHGPPYPLHLFPEHTAVNMPDGHGLPHRLQAVPVSCPGMDTALVRDQECESGSQMFVQRRQAVWEADVKVVRGGGGGGGGSSSRELLGQTGGLLLSDSLFSKELEDMGKHLAEVEKDLAKLAEQGKLAQRSPNSPHSSLLLTPLFHTSLPASLPSTLPLTGQPSRPQSPILTRSAKPSSIGYPLVSPKLSPLLTRKPTSLTMTGSHRTHSPSNSGSRITTPRTPSSRPMTPNSLLTSKSAMTAVTPGVGVHGGHRGHKEVTFRKSRSRPVTPTSQPTRPRPLLTPPGLSTTDSLGKASSLKAYLSEDEFYKQLQAIRQPWHIPIDTESDILEPLEQDKSGVRDANKRSVFSGLPLQNVAIDFPTNLALAILPKTVGSPSPWPT
uniref:Chromosome 8 open reading frame 34 n=2 Tax=Oncorhynchus mykiss TaxID=8022 RepID=A0A8K9WMV5_ONCMY